MRVLDYLRQMDEELEYLRSENSRLVALATKESTKSKVEKESHYRDSFYKEIGIEFRRLLVLHGIGEGKVKTLYSKAYANTKKKWGGNNE